MTWYPGVNLIYPRYGHSCGLFKKGGSATAVVVGGSHPDFAFVQKSVEMLNLEMVGHGIGWYHGPQVPFNSVGGALISQNKKLMLINGHMKIDLKCRGNACFWTPGYNKTFKILSCCYGCAQIYH